MLAISSSLRLIIWSLVSFQLFLPSKLYLTLISESSYLEFITIFLAFSPSNEKLANGTEFLPNKLFAIVLQWLLWILSAEVALAALFKALVFNKSNCTICDGSVILFLIRFKMSTKGNG